MLTVLCPDSLANDNEQTNDQSQLRSRLRYSRRTAQQSDSADPAIGVTPARITPIEHWLINQFEVPSGYMVGAFARYNETQAESSADNLLTPDNSLTIVPAHLHAGLDHLRLQPPESIAATAHEAADLIAAANDFLANDNITLHMLEPQCWLMKTPKRFDVELSSSAMAVGRSVDIYMPAGKDGRPLRSLINELAMLWHEHPVNLARENEGLPKINTVWPEGYAAPFAPLTGSARFDQIVSDNPATGGMASVLNIPAIPLTGTNLAQLTKTNVLVELQAGASAALQMLETIPGAANLVLANAQQWIQISVHTKDRFCRWRSDPCA